MDHRITVKGKKGVEVNFTFQTGYFYNNCAINTLGQFTARKVKAGKLTQQELEDAVDTLAFHKSFIDMGGVGGGPSCWVVSAGLSYGSDQIPLEGKSTLKTSHVMAAMAKGKLGAWVSTPIYDNHAHPNADSLQVCMIWFPEQRVNHILTDRPWYHIPTSKIRKGMEEKWWARTKQMRPYFPETLHRAVGMVLNNFGWTRANPIEEVDVPAEKALKETVSGWPDIA